MRLTPIGKFVLLILVIGGAIGGWRAWQSSQTPGKKGGGMTFPKFPHFGGKDGSGGKNSSGLVEVPFVITAGKKGWAVDQIQRFNELHKDKWLIKTQEVESRDAMQGILFGKYKPALWCPSSPLWLTRLGEAWVEKHGGNTILDMNDPNASRVFLKSPLVFLTTREKARFLRPLLAGNDPWGELHKLNAGGAKAPWGRFRWSFADPIKANSGILTMGLILYDYGQRTGQAGSLEQVATSDKFLSYMQQLTRNLVYDVAAREGTSSLAKSFQQDTSRYDVITAYEGTALDAVATRSDLAVIYPNPTANSENAVGILSADWVTPEQKEAAQAFLQFLGQKEALQSGIKYNFRPVQKSTALNLDGELSHYAAQGFQESYSAIDLPPYTALNAAAYRWTQNKK